MIKASETSIDMPVSKIELVGSAVSDIDRLKIPQATLAEIAKSIGQDPMSSQDCLLGDVRVRRCMGYEVVFTLIQEPTAPSAPLAP